ncbi:MAG: hypothetical protein WCW35_12470 [Bacteroidota bacterium]
MDIVSAKIVQQKKTDKITCKQKQFNDKKNTIIQNIIFACFFSLLFSGCPKDDVPCTTCPQPTNPLAVSIFDVSSTEVFLKISLSSSELNRIVSLKRNDSTIITISLTGSDSVIIDDSLRPRTLYTYELVSGDWNAKIQETTKDTTQHDFAWETYNLGDLGVSASILNDAVIINDTLIYIVGEIYIKDATPIGEKMYNAAVVKGKNISLQEVPYRMVGQSYVNPISAICATSKSDIWFGGNGLVHWDGNDFIPQEAFVSLWGPNKINKMWCSVNGVYVVGENGSLAFNSNTLLQKLQSGTTDQIFDVYGVINPKDQTEKIYCAVLGYPNPPSHAKILKITNKTKVDSIQWGIPRDVFSVWSVKGFPLFVAAARGGIYDNTLGQWRGTSFSETIVIQNVRGNSLNDIFVNGSGNGAFVAHYNGITWHQYTELAGSADWYSSIAVNNHTVVLVGFKAERAVVSIGRRK